jgi:predicted small lipoprotein YifL
MMHRQLTKFLLIAILFSSLCACGQSGKLYLPNKHKIEKGD